MRFETNAGRVGKDDGSIWRSLRGLVIRGLSGGKSAVVSVWSDETYRILGFTRETNPTLDLVFKRIHPEDRDRLEQRDRATQNGMDLDVEHRILMADGVIKYVHVVAHAEEMTPATSSTWA